MTSIAAGTGSRLLSEPSFPCAKYEGVAPVGDLPTAIMSANYAAEHFGAAFAIATAGGAVAHSSCVAFGLDRVALALLSAHGLDVDRWPVGVRQRLWQ